MKKIVNGEIIDMTAEEIAERESAVLPGLPSIGTALPVLTPRQLRLGLLSIGITEADVEQAIAALPDADAAIIEWRHASTYDRSHPLVGALGQFFDLPEDQIDTLWTWSAGL